MTKKLYAVPFAFKVAGTVMIMAENPEAAKILANEQIQADPSNLPEANIFFDESENTVKEIFIVDADGQQTTAPVLGDPIESDADPVDYGFENEDEDEEAEAD